MVVNIGQFHYHFREKLDDCLGHRNWVGLGYWAMENLFLMFVFAIITIAVISFILPDEKKTRTRSAKDSVKQELPWVLYLFISALVIGVLLTVGNAIF